MIHSNKYKTKKHQILCHPDLMTLIEKELALLYLGCEAPTEAKSDLLDYDLSCNRRN